MRKNASAFTIIELIVVLAIGALLIFMWLSGLSKQKRYYSRISCVANLKQMGVAYRVWANDNNDQFPAQSTNGWKEIATTGKAARYCWTNYALMHTELGESPKLLICPADKRSQATVFFTNGIGIPGIENTNISYFVGVEASKDYPQSILGGDRNLARGPRPTNDYGFSPGNGMGANVVLSTNDSNVCWSLKMHSAMNPSGGGNILLADGSVQQCSSSRFRTDYLVNSSVSTNTNSTIRLIFP